MSKVEKRVIHLRVYRADKNNKTVVYDADQKPINENHLVKMIHNTLEFDNWLKRCIASGIVKIDVLGFLKKDWKSGAFEYDEIESKEVERIQSFLKPEVKKEKVLSEGEKAMQAQLDAQAAQIAELTSLLSKGGDPPKIEIQVKSDKPEAKSLDKVLKENVSEEELTELKKQYEELTGKPPHHKMKPETLKQKVNELK